MAERQLEREEGKDHVGEVGWMGGWLLYNLDTKSDFGDLRPFKQMSRQKDKKAKMRV